MVTPVYDVTASAPGNPNLKYRAEWELMGGPGTFPLSVIYFNGNGSTSRTQPMKGFTNEVITYTERVSTNAVYRVTGMTNVNGRLYPTGFVFEQYVGRGRPRIRKQAFAVVSVIRPVCSLDSLLPSISDGTVVADRRLAQAEEPIKAFTYQVTGGRSWQPVADAKKAYARGKKPQKPSPIMLPLIGTLLCAPLMVWATHSWWRRRKAG